MSWPVGLGVWFSLWVREVPGSNPGLAQRTDWNFLHLPPYMNMQIKTTTNHPECRSSRNENTVKPLAAKIRDELVPFFFFFFFVFHNYYIQRNRYPGLETELSSHVKHPPACTHDRLPFWGGDVPMFAGEKIHISFGKEAEYFQAIRMAFFFASMQRKSSFSVE